MSTINKILENSIIDKIANSFAFPEMLNEKFPNHQVVLYKIENEETKDYYIGTTSRKDQRLKEHLSDLKSNTHQNTKFQESFNSNSNFKIVTIPVLNKNIGFNLEKIILKECKDDELCLNLRGSVNLPSLSDESKNKISNSLKEFYLNNPDRVEKIREQQLGKIISEEAKHKQSISMKKYYDNNPSRKEEQKNLMIGNTFNLNTIQSEETKDKRRNSMYGKNLGKTHTEETKQYLSLKHTGKQLSEEHKANISLANTGRINTPEAIENMRLAALSRARTVIVDNIIFDSIRNAAIAFNISDATVRDRIESKTGKFDNWQWG